MNNTIGQIVSIIALVFSVSSVQFKDVKHVLIGQILANLSTSLSFWFLGGLSGAWICIVAAVQTLIMYIANKKGISVKSRNILLAFFLAAYIVGTILVYQSWADIVSCTCSLLFVMSIVQTDTRIFRMFISANSFLWIVYDLSTGAYINAVTHTILLGSLVLAMIRLDRKKKQ